MSYMNIENFKEYLCFKFAWLKHTLMTYRNFYNKYLKIFLFKQILPKSSPLSLSRGSNELHMHKGYKICKNIFFLFFRKCYFTEKTFLTLYIYLNVSTRIWIKVLSAVYFTALWETLEN